MSMSSEESLRLAAALEQLEAEQQRRQDEKIVAGEAIRLPLHCVLTPGGDANKLVEEAKTHKIAAARAAGETREIVFEEPTVMITGVPRSDDFGKWNHEPVLAQYPDRYAATTSAKAPNVKPAPANPAALEWKPFRVTVTPPSERDMGMIIEARYAVAGGELRLDFQGKLYAEALGPNDDPLVVARRLLRQKYGRHEEFYGRILYPPRSIH